MKKVMVCVLALAMLGVFAGCQSNIHQGDLPNVNDMNQKYYEEHGINNDGANGTAQNEMENYNMGKNEVQIPNAAPNQRLHDGEPVIGGNADENLNSNLKNSTTDNAAQITKKKIDSNSSVGAGDGIGDMANDVRNDLNEGKSPAAVAKEEAGEMGEQAKNSLNEAGKTIKEKVEQAGDAVSGAVVGGGNTLTDTLEDKNHDQNAKQGRFGVDMNYPLSTMPLDWYDRFHIITNFQVF